jgi:hypothetical protein
VDHQLAYDIQLREIPPRQYQCRSRIAPNVKKSLPRKSAACHRTQYRCEPS